MEYGFKKYLVTLDNNLRLVEAEKAFYEYVGQPRPELLEDVIPPQDLMLLKNTLFALSPGGSNLCCFRIRTLTGKLSWIAGNIEGRNGYTFEAGKEPENDTGEDK